MIRNEIKEICQLHEILNKRNIKHDFKKDVQDYCEIILEGKSNNPIFIIIQNPSLYQLKSEHLLVFDKVKDQVIYLTVQETLNRIFQAIHPIVTILLDDQNTIQIELYPELCPNSVNGLIEAIEYHAFDNMAIERVVPNFVIQPWCDETKKSEFYQYVCDLEVNPDDNFESFSVGLAGDGNKIGVPSCFFICIADAFHLNQKFTKVGRVISGFEELKHIESVELVDVPNSDGVAFKTPVNDEIIETITIDLKGYKASKCNKFLEKN